MPKMRSVPTTCADVISEKFKSRTVPRAPAPAEENPDSTPIGNASQGSQREFLTAKFGFCARGKNETLEDAARRMPRMIVTTPEFSDLATERKANMPSTRPGTAPRMSKRK